MKRVVCLLLALALSASLTACSKDQLQDIASDWIIRVVTLLGLREENPSDEEEAPRVEATAGGSVVFPEGFDNRADPVCCLVQDGTLYVGFNGITNRSTDYFVATSSSVTITAYATSTNADASAPPQYKAALWMLSEDMGSTSYVEGTTVYFSAAGDGRCYTYTVTGLTPGRRYKVNISYDTVYYFVTGGMTVSTVGGEDLLNIAPEEGA